MTTVRDPTPASITTSRPAVASPPARNDDDDWFAAEEPPPKKAPKEVAGYLSKFDADFERAMAKHRRHL